MPVILQNQQLFIEKTFKFQQKRKVKFVLTSARRLDAGARAPISAWSVKTLYIKEHAYPAARVLRGEFTQSFHLQSQTKIYHYHHFSSLVFIKLIRKPAAIVIPSARDRAQDQMPTTATRA
jgi:hypothetical protein